MDSNPKILAVGAAGRYAGPTVPALVAHGADVRGLVRDPARVDIARRNGASDVVIGDLRDRASLDEAMRGVDGAYFIAPVYPNDESQQIGRMFVQAAKHAAFAASCLLRCSTL